MGEKKKTFLQKEKKGEGARGGSPRRSYHAKRAEKTQNKKKKKRTVPTREKGGKEKPGKTSNLGGFGGRNRRPFGGTGKKKSALMREGEKNSYWEGGRSCRQERGRVCLARGREEKKSLRKGEGGQERFFADTIRRKVCVPDSLGEKKRKEGEL